MQALLLSSDKDYLMPLLRIATEKTGMTLLQHACKQHEGYTQGSRQHSLSQQYCHKSGLPFAQATGGGEVPGAQFPPVR